jgi:gluconolactonase
MHRRSLVAAPVLTAALTLTAVMTTAPLDAQTPAPTAAPAAAAPQPTPGIPGVVAAGTKVELLKSGLSGTEGPIALPDGSLIFTEREANRVTKIAPDGTFTPYIEDTEGVNSLTIDPQGRLLAVQWIKPQVVNITTKPFVVLADRYNGVPFGRPNDLIADKKGGVYFSDPGLTAPNKPTLFYLNPQGQVVKLTDDIDRPNGVQLSRDETVLYVANTAGPTILAYDIAKDGTISNRRDFATLDGVRKTDTGLNSGADGLTIDSDGRLYVCSNIGVQVFGPDGKALGVIPLPVAPQNLAFAGPNKRALYVVGRGNAYRIAMQAQGFTGRPK